MRWQGGPEREPDEVSSVLDDLEMQAEGLHLADRAVEADELSAAQYAEVGLVARVAASIGCDVHVCTDGPELHGRLAAVGADWMRVDQTGGSSFVHLRHVVTIAGLVDGAVPDAARPIAARLSLRSVLRRLADETASCALHLVGGRVLHGSPLGVGADFVEIRHGDAGGRLTVPLAAVAVVQERQ